MPKITLQPSWTVSISFVEELPASELLLLSLWKDRGVHVYRKSENQHQNYQHSHCGRATSIRIASTVIVEMHPTSKFVLLSLLWKRREATIRIDFILQSLQKGKWVQQQVVMVYGWSSLCAFKGVQRENAHLKKCPEPFHHNICQISELFLWVLSFSTYTPFLTLSIYYRFTNFINNLNCDIFSDQ